MFSFCWKSKYSVGVSELDEQHHAIMDRLNELHEEMVNGKVNEAVAQGNCIWNFVEPGVTLPAIGRGVRFMQEGSSHVLQRNFGTVFILLGGAGGSA